MKLLTKKVKANDKTQIQFDMIADSALSRVDAVVMEFIPNGKRVGTEWIALNPNRNDKNLGSFKVSLRTGKWADFATNITGGDLISLVAYVQDLSNADAAHVLSQKFGLETTS